MSRRVALVFCTLLTVGSAAFADERPRPTARKPAGKKAPVAKVNGAARSGELTWCPIADQNFVVASDTPGVEHNGKTYYFCCDECAEKFKADPARWVAAIENHR